MARDSWPIGLPQQLSQTGFNKKPPDTLIKTTVDVGIGKRRSRTTSGTSPINGNIKMTREQVKLFDIFFRETLVNGALSFDWLQPLTELPAVFRFSGVPTYASGPGIMFTVSLPLEILSGT